MTPHFGGGTEHAQRRMTALVCRNLDAHFAGKPVVSPVPELRDLAGVVKPKAA
jgi:phosphoglycerate dehydrogenase-like enzyme